MKVLIADDDPISRRLLQLALGNAGYEVVTATNGAQALHVLQGQDCPPLAVLDWMMPEVDGVEVCRAIRARGENPYVYIVLLTAKGHRSEIIEGLEAGADDYIVKPFDLQELKARLRAGKRIVELQEQLVSAGERLRVQETHDSLTGFLNRTAILETLEREFERSERMGTRMAVIMADIDHFKRINDTYGHQAGDAVLREIAERMQKTVRVYDSVGRYGGEEFLIVSPGCGSKEAQEQAERLRSIVAAGPAFFRDQALSATMSLGVAVAAHDGQVPAELLRLADEALYAAKNEGRDRVAVRCSVES
jgi:two-component system cell cycle response regulator